MISLFKRIFFKKLLTTKNGLYQLNTRFKTEYYSGGVFKRVGEFNDDFVDFIKKYRLGFNTAFSFSNSCRLIALYSRIEWKAEKEESHRHHFLDICNGLSNQELSTWVNTYNEFFDDPNYLNKVYKNLDDLYEAILYKDDGDDNYVAINKYLLLLGGDSVHDEFLNLFKFSKNKSIDGRNYLKSEIAKLKVYISVFCMMNMDLPRKQSYSVNYIDCTTKIFDLVDHLINHQREVLKAQNGEHEWNNNGVSSLINQCNYAY